MINSVFHCRYRYAYLVNQLWIYHCTILKKFKINWDHYVSLFFKHHANVVYTVNFGNMQSKRSIYTIIFRCIYYNEIDINFLTSELISYLYLIFTWLTWYKIKEYDALYGRCVHFIFYRVDTVYHLIKLLDIYYINNLLFLCLLFLSRQNRYEDCLKQ